MRRLLIRPGAIGDCILCFPALERLRAEYTEVWISSSVVPLVHFAEVVRPIASTGLDLVGVGDLEIAAPLKAKLESFDSIVSWYGTNRPEFREALLGVGVDCQFFAALPPSDYAGHATDFFATQAGAPGGLVPRVQVPHREHREGIVIHPYSGSARKNWPLSCYRELASRLPGRVQWTAGPEEQLAEAVRFENLKDLADWIGGARLYIGNDSGITHLAAATGTRVIALFGPASSQTWIPRGENVTVLACATLKQLSVEKVAANAQSVFARP